VGVAVAPAPADGLHETPPAPVEAPPGAEPPVAAMPDRQVLPPAPAEKIDAQADSDLPALDDHAAGAPDA
jgi:hypothetical protein